MRKKAGDGPRRCQVCRRKTRPSPLDLPDDRSKVAASGNARLGAYHSECEEQTGIGILVLFIGRKISDPTWSRAAMSRRATIAAEQGSAGGIAAGAEDRAGYVAILRPRQRSDNRRAVGFRSSWRSPSAAMPSYQSSKAPASGSTRSSSLSDREGQTLRFPRNERGS